MGACTQHRFRAHARAGLLAGLCLLAAAGGPVAAQPADPYLTPEPLPRLALLLGASRYAALPELRNVPRDVDVLYAALDDLGFSDILVVTDPCLEDIHAALTALENRIRLLAPDGGATVWVFAAGHGAMDSHDQYLIPVEFDARQLADNEIHEVALPSEYIEDRLEQTFAGAGVVVVDACRTPFVQPDANAAASAAAPGCARRGSLVWRKLSQAAPVERIGYAGKVQIARVGVAYSTRPGAEAPEAGDAERPGTYINALASALRAPDPKAADVFRKAYETVTASANQTHYRTEPDFRPKALGDAWLRAPGDARASTNAEIWRNVLAVGPSNPDTVRQFVANDSASEYLRPALRWLRDHDPPAAQQVTVVRRGHTATVELHIDRSSDVTILSNPTPGVPQAQQRRSLRDERLIVDRFGWGRLVNAPAATPRFIDLKSIVNDPADLPAFWGSTDVIDVSGCFEGDRLDGCLAALPQAQLRPQPGERVNVLAVESSTSDGGPPSSTAFQRAFAVQQALDRLGIAYARSRIRVVPGSFAPSSTGRVLVKRSHPKET